MKNVIKGFAFATVVLFLAACKNDKPTTAATESATTTATPAATPATETVAMTTPAAAIPTAAAPVAAATSAAAAAAKAAPSTAKPAPVAAEPTKVAPPTAAVTPAPAVVAGGKTTSVKFDETSYDWGTIAEGEKMTHIFKFKNTGTNDMIISDAHGSCGCTVPEWPKEPIKPGKTSQIKVIFDSKGKAGDQTKNVTVTANTEPTNMVLMIKGKVTAKDEKK